LSNPEPTTRGLESREIAVLKTASVHLLEPRTALYRLIEQRVVEVARPLLDRLEAWGMMGARTRLDTTDFSGQPVRYHGVTFEGSPRTVFWSGFFDPFMLAAARQTLEWVIAYCHERHLDPEEYVAEAKSLLGLLAEAMYEDMARIDQRLRGGGFPDSVTLVDVSPQVQTMKRQLDDLARALTYSGQSAHSPSRGKDEVFQLKPSVWGFGVDLRALWRWLRRSTRRHPGDRRP
jgi:hypothetical protein